MQFKRLLFKSMYIAVPVALLFAAAGKSGEIAGFLSGMAIGLANFAFLQRSVRSMFGSSGASPLRVVGLYYLQFMAKMLVLMGIFFVLLTVVRLGWLGLLAGIIAAMIVYLSVLAQRKACP